MGILKDKIGKIKDKKGKMIGIQWHFLLASLKVILVNEIEKIISDFIIFYKKFNGYETNLKESEKDLIKIFIGEYYEQ